MALDLSTLQLVPLPRTRYHDGGREVEEGEEGYDELSDPEPEFDFLCDVTRHIKLNGQVVGKIEACIIKREDLNGEFHELMDAPSQELNDFALTLFDRNGRLRSEFIAPHGEKSGTGVFGDEISEGAFAYITEINITKRELRSQGLGKAALDLFKAFLLDTESGDRAWNQQYNPVKFVLCWPVVVFQEPDNYDPALQVFPGPQPAPNPVKTANRTRNLERLISFFRDNGFRRVGTSDYFAFALDHPSRQLPKDQDTVKPSTPPEASVNPERDFPLHLKIANSVLPLEKNALLALRDLIAISPLSVVQTSDSKGYTPLHIAASARNLPAIQSLVARSRKELLATTLKGATPLELLKAERRSSQDSKRAPGLGEESPEEMRYDRCAVWLERETASEISMKRKREEDVEGSAVAGGPRRKL